LRVGGLAYADTLSEAAITDIMVRGYLHAMTIAA
jgi:hypothetical protein